MSILNKRESFALVLGDVIIFVFALWLMLLFRYGAVPEQPIFLAHLFPFSLLFLIWISIFFIAGLYEKHTLLLQSRLTKILIKAGSVNAVIAVVFFYFIPIFGITPKFNLFIYLFISSFFIGIWRINIFPLLGAKKKQNAILIGTGRELHELQKEINENSRYDIRFVASFEINNLDSMDIGNTIAKKIEGEGVSLVAIDLQNKKIEPILPFLYGLIFKKVRFVDIHRLYEDIFDRIPLSLVKYSWFLEYVSLSLQDGYDGLKRAMDIIFSSLGLLSSAVFYPFIALAIKLDDRGSVFIFQERVGLRGKIFKIVKFRTMKFDDAGHAHARKENCSTRVGPFLRKSRLDELPQFWNVLRGDLSLVGPRPELPSFVKLYEREVPYYSVRHLLKPGLFGWAQLYHEKHPHHSADVLETSVKLSYDLFYIKNRSLFLDLKIALKTLKTILSRSGA